MARLFKSLSTRPRKALQPHSQPTRPHDPNPCQASQEQSSFFSKLPPEIRNQIYCEVFGGAICHIVSWQSGLGHFCCRGVKSDELQFNAPCWGHAWCDDEPDASVERGKQKASLLTVCKRSHDEAIATLYVSSKFVFTDPSILLVFASAVPRQNMSHISFIEISAPTVYALFHAGAAVAIRHFEDWQRSVTVLQEMAGLKAVYVVVPNSSVYGGWEQSQTSERYVLEPLLQVKRSLETFVVSIGWYAGGGPGQPDMEAHRYPFELRRFDGHLPGMQ